MAVLTVGIGKEFLTITAAAQAAVSGDTIDVFADHVYTNDFPLLNKSITLQAVDGEVKMVATVSPPNGKAMIVAGVKGATIVINGFDISGVKVADANGAAIRYQGGNLSLTNDYFHNNQEGILGGANDPNGHITIDHSEFAANGAGDGFSHNIYVNHIATLTVTNSYIHDANLGHEIKSRAANTVIENNRIFDNNATASYSIDLPDAGNATISNNIIEQGPNSDNLFIMAYGEDPAAHNPGTTVSISDNTIVNDETSGRLLVNKTTTALSFTNNELWNLPASQYGGPIAASGNVNLAVRLPLDTSPLKFVNPTSSGPGTVCYARGTMIRTPDGELPVEKLRRGKQVTTLVDGDEVPRAIIWLGHRRIDLTTHPRPETVAPIRIERDAIADGTPHRDLLVSPDHAIFVDGMLICARQLVNGTTIRQERDWTAVDYYHVELDRHAILLAEGLPAESYLDTGNSGFFANSDAPLVLHPDLTDGTDYPTREAGSCAPFVSDEVHVRPVWQGVADRAAAIGRTGPPRLTTTDVDLRLLADRHPVKPVFSDSDRVMFVLPHGAREVRLVSRAQPPTEVRPWLDDRRRLGVRVKRIVLRGADEVREVPIDHPDLTRGWWAVERDGPTLSRWTDGEAVLPLPAMRADIVLEIHLAGSMIYAVDVPPEDGTKWRAAV